MSLITPEQLHSSWTQAQVDKYINEMPVPALNFAMVSSLYQRFYGVLNGSMDGERLSIQDPSDPDRSDIPDRFILNACARFAYPRIADTVVSALEQEIGYTLTPRYITEEIPFMSANYKFMTKFPGVAALNVEQTWHALDDEAYDEAYVELYVQEIPAENIVYPYPDGITPAVRVSDSLVTNPNQIIIRNENGAIFPWFSDDTHPMRRVLGSYWQLALAVNRKNYTDETLYVQHKKFVYVDIPAPTLPAGAVFHPVYPDTNQIIPQAKPKEVIVRSEEDGDHTYWRYWFYVYTLVHPDFVAETVDLQVGEFYKLYPFIWFRYTLDTATVPTIVVTQGTRVTTFTPTLTLTGSEYGIFHVNWDNCCEAYHHCCKQRAPDSIMLRYTYKTNPALLPEKYGNQIGRLLDAACGRIAAQLPSHECGCPVNWGYIMDKQKMLKDTFYNVLTGETQDKTRYGHMIGQLEYAETLNNCFKYSRPLNLSLKS